MKFTERLFNENKNLWNKYLSHPFILEMENGSLPIEKFKYYMIQDYFYLKEYAKVFAIGISKAKSGEDIENLSKSLSGIAWETDHVHTKYMQRIGITEEELQNTKPSLSNLGYTSYMIAKAFEDDVLNAYLAVLSCSWSYGFIGQEINKRSPHLAEDNIYGEWIKVYSCDEYDEINSELMDIIDKKCQNLSENRLQELAEIFRICSEFELRFWDMAYTIGKSDELDYEK